MTGNKPIIFLYPLSSSLKKYFDLVQENHEEEGIDIYEVDVLGEAAQLIPTLGPSVILASSPKKCAQMLQQNSKALKVNSSKVLLLSEKELPSKIVQKLQKFGLTEYLQEPVNPKSLIYKVTLLLKSLPAISEEEEEEDQVFSSEGEVASNEGQKQRVEKGILIEEDTGNKERKEHEEITLDLSSEKVKPTEEIELFNLGDELKKDLASPIEIKSDDKDESEEAPPEVDHIDTYYKTKQEKKVELELNNGPTIPTEYPDRDEEHDLGDQTHHLKNSDFSMEFERPEIEEITIDEDELNSVASKDSSAESSLDLESATKELSKEDLELNLKKAAIEASDLDNDESSSLEDELIKHGEDLILEMNKEEKIIKEDVELVLTDKKEESDELESEDSENTYKVEDQDELKIESADAPTEKKDANLSLEAASDELIAEESDERNSNERAKAKNKHSTLELDAEKQDNNEEKKEIDDDLYGTGKKDEKLDLEGEALKKKAKDKKLDLTSGQADDSDPEKNEDEAQVVLSDSEKLKLEGKEQADDEQSKLGLDAGAKRKDNSSELNLTDAESKKENSEAIESVDSDQRVSSGDTTLQIDAAKKKKLKDLELKAAQAKNLDDLVDGIEYDWDTAKKQRSDEDFGPWISKKSKTIEISFDKEDRGEETIDYRQLKKQFDDASLLERERGRRSSTGIEQSGLGREEGKEGTAQELIEGEEIDLQSAGEEEEEETKEVFEPDSRGVEFMIRTLQMYLDGRNDKQIYLYLSNTVFKEFKGIVGFFINNRDNGASEETFSAAHNIEYSGNRDKLIANWEETKEKNRFEWSTVRLPQWTDEKFQSKTNQFIYPFYEGIDHIGYVAVDFPEGITKSESSKIEMTLEGVRAIYLEKLREGGIQGSYERDSNEKPVEEKKSLLGNFFGKKK